MRYWQKSGVQEPMGAIIWCISLNLNLQICHLAAWSWATAMMSLSQDKMQHSSSFESHIYHDMHLICVSTFPAILLLSCDMRDLHRQNLWMMIMPIDQKWFQILPGKQPAETEHPAYVSSKQTVVLPLCSSNMGVTRNDFLELLHYHTPKNGKVTS